MCISIYICVYVRVLMYVYIYIYVCVCMCKFVFPIHRVDGVTAVPGSTRVPIHGDFHAASFLLALPPNRTVGHWKGGAEKFLLA